MVAGTYKPHFPLSRVFGVATLLLSLLAHWLFYTTGFHLFPDPPSVSASGPIPVTLAPEYWLPSTKRRPLPLDKQVVETQKADNEKVDPDAKYLSNRDQTVAEQTRAARTDKFQEAQSTGTRSEQAQTPLSEEGTSHSTTDWQSLSLHDLGLGGSGLSGATDDRLEDIAVGDKTVLSTREFQYFSYYQRIKDLLRQYWKPTVEKKLLKIWGRGKNVNDPELVTRISVTLTDQGSLQRVARVASSGLSEIDDAAEEAFRQAAPFPNPPTGMVEPDGFVRIQWDFILHMEAAPQIQYRTVGGAPAY